MSSPVITSESPWLPSSHEQDMIQRLTSRSFHAYTQETSVSNESMFAQSVALAASFLIAQPSAECGIFRADKALLQGMGSCIAYSEIASYILDAAGLAAATAWRTNNNTEGHAFAIWRAENHVWQVDGYSGIGLIWEDDHTQRDELHALAQEAIESQAPTIIESNDAEKRHIAQSRPFDGNYAVFDDSSIKTVIMPSSTAVPYFTQRAQRLPVNYNFW